MAELHTSIRLLSELVNDLDDLVRDSPVELEPDLIAFAMLEEARRNLAIISRDLEQKLGAVMPKNIIAEGVTFDRRKHKARTQWDKEALLSAVLDSRLFNPNTGELLDETPTDKIKAVFNLNPPRTSALKERGIDADQFCVTEDRGYQIQITS